MEKIVLGYDGSENAEHALERTAAIANGATVTVVSAVHVHPTARKTGSRLVDRGEITKRQRGLAKAKQFLDRRGIATRTLEAHGDPAESIVAEATAQRADLIVVGTHGRNAAERLVLGSVSTKVVHEAPCDVLVVR